MPCTVVSSTARMVKSGIANRRGGEGGQAEVVRRVLRGSQRPQPTGGDREAHRRHCQAERPGPDALQPGHCSFEDRHRRSPMLPGPGLPRGRCRRRRSCRGRPPGPPALGLSIGDASSTLSLSKTGDDAGVDRAPHRTPALYLRTTADRQRSATSFRSPRGPFRAAHRRLSEGPPQPAEAMRIKAPRTRQRMTTSRSGTASRSLPPGIASRAGSGGAESAALAGSAVASPVSDTGAVCCAAGHSPAHPPGRRAARGGAQLPSLAGRKSPPSCRRGRRPPGRRTPRGPAPGGGRSRCRSGS